MQECAGSGYVGSGYVVPVSSLKSILTVELGERLDAILDCGDLDDVESFVGDHYPETFPMYSIYRPGDEDTVDDLMEKGVFYFIFDADDLYIRTPKPELESLTKNGIKSPEFARWTVWG